MVDAETVKRIAEFHGHMCPGLAIGIRAAELALQEIGHHSSEEDVVAIVETDMCPVDAIQFLTGCTYGKGNLVHLDYGKNAFTFIRRSDGKALRLVTRSEAWGGGSEEHRALMAKVQRKAATPAEQQQFQALQQQRSQAILARPLEALFTVTPVKPQVPTKARFNTPVTCTNCGETMMETRSRLFQGQILCVPCFESHDRRYAG